MRLVLPILLLLAACGPSDTDTAGQAWFHTDREMVTGWVLSGGPGGVSHWGLTDDGRAYVGTTDGAVLLEPAPGEAPIGALGPYAGLEHALVTPLLADGVALLRNVRGDLLAVDLQTDAVSWQSVDHMPVLVGEPGARVAVMNRNTLDGALLGRDLHTGEVMWTQEDHAQLLSGIDDVEGSLLCGADMFDLALFDTDTQSLRWRVEHELVDSGAPSVVQCAFQDDGVLLLGLYENTEQATMVRFDMNGKELHRADWPHAGRLPTRVVVRDDGVVVVWSEAAMALYDHDLAVIASYDDRAPFGVDPVSGNMYLRTEGPPTLTDAHFNPLWAGGFGVPINGYAFIDAMVVGERVYWTDTQSGVLGVDRWTRYGLLR